MRKLIKISIFVFVFVLLISCAAEHPADDEKINGYASFYAMYDFASKIGGDKVDVKLLIPSGTEPHDWEPTAKNVADITNADFIIYNGGSMESWIDKAINVANETDSKTIFVRALEGVETNQNEDPHVWLNPMNAKTEFYNIYRAFAEIDSENAAYYEENYNMYAKMFDELDAAYKEKLSYIENRTIVVAHEAYAYLCSAYGLTQVGIEGIAADSEPSPAKLLEIINFINKNQIKYIFFEELSSIKAVQTVSNETGVEMLVLSHFEGLTEEEREAGEDYFSIMYRNLDQLETALK